ncbi:hypothetical protein, partial [Dichelobacter nodosus]|uniref:hypothetical protein n=1 Tax=Dichelobacter nodosus TaxID=870 RepID=UPI0039EC5717
NDTNINKKINIKDDGILIGEREIIIDMLNVGMTKIKIANYLSINRKCLYRYLLKNPISEDELKASDIRIKKMINDANINKEINIKDKVKYPKNELPDGLPINWKKMNPNERRAYLDRFIKEDVKKILD